MQVLFQPEQAVTLLLGQLGDGDARRPGDDLGDVLRRHLWHRRLTRLGRVQLLLRLVDALAQLARLRVVFARHRGILLTLQPCQPLLQLASIRRRRAGAQSHPGAGLVDQINGLVGQKPPGDVAVGELGGGHQGVIADAHLVVRLIAVAQPTQDLDGVVDRWLGHQYGGKPAF